MKNAMVFVLFKDCSFQNVITVQTAITYQRYKYCASIKLSLPICRNHLW